jgi:hypothetical protein
MNYRKTGSYILLLAAFLFVSLQVVTSQSLAINEVMAANRSTISDENGDYEDWIELYNYGSVAVSLNGFGLTDDPENPFRWTFPSVMIQPGEYLLVWASGKNRRSTGSPLHTNFSISAGGEEIFLFTPDEQIIDQIPPTTIPEGTSYGRFPDGTGDFHYFREPTPGEQNGTARYAGILDRVEFSHEPGFYTSNFSLELSHPDNDVTIYYTWNGSVPDNTSMPYNSDIVVSDRSNADNQHSMIPTNFITDWRGWKEPEGKVAKGTIIRAVATKPGYIESPVSSASYFVFPEGENRYSVDVVSIITDHDNLFSDSHGIYVPGTHYTGNQSTGNYYQRGIEWERPASFEFFGDDTYFQQDIGIRIHGGWTRRDPIKSLRLYARGDYGESRFNYRFFPELPYTSYNRLLLRNSGNDWANTMFRDAAAQSLVSHILDIQAYRPSVVFINGEYWGIKNFRERVDQHYIGRRFGVNPDNIDLLTRDNEVKEGDNQHYNRMIEFVRGNDMRIESNYQQVQEMMDVENYLDYYSAQVYYANTDWPANNIDFWRLRVPYDPAAPKGHDGRWRWILYDVDRALGLFQDYTYNYDMIAYITQEFNNNREWPNFLFRNLLENETFKNSFINRLADHLNTIFIPSRVHSVIDDFSNRIEQEIPEHIHRWRYPSSPDQWQQQVQTMHNNAANRPDYVRQHLMDHFGIVSKINLTVDIDDPAAGFVRVNSVDIRPTTPGVPANAYPWKGIYFDNIPLEITAVPNNGYEFSHWTGSGISNNNNGNPVLKVTPAGEINVQAHFVTTEATHLISYWFFGAGLPNDTPLESIQPLYSAVEDVGLTYVSSLEGYPFDEDHQYWRMASMERRNQPTDINYHQWANSNIPFEESGMRGIQIRQPLADNNNQNAIIFNLPTINLSAVEFHFAAKDEGAANRLVIDYSVTSGNPQWTNAGLDNNNPNIYGTYQLYSLDFSSIQEVNNNPDFKVRIRFQSDNMTAREGNRVTFNNFSFHAVPGEDVPISVTDPIEADSGIRIYPNPVRDYLRVDFERGITEMTVISLVSANGMTVAEKTLYPGDNPSVSFNPGNVNPGVYIVIVRSGQQLISKRVLVL